MTEFFQTHLGAGFGWFVANLILILLIALPLMLAVAMIIYADRKIWAAIALRVIGGTDELVPEPREPWVWLDADEDEDEDATYILVARCSCLVTQCTCTCA